MSLLDASQLAPLPPIVAPPDPQAANIAAIGAASPPAPTPPVDPTAGIASMLATPDQQLNAYAKTHAAYAALRILGATLSDVGAGFGGREGTALANTNADLYARAAQPLQLMQAKARIAGLMQAYASASPAMKSLILTDPESAMKVLAQNETLQKIGVNDTLANANGGAMAPVPSVTPFKAEGGVVLNQGNGQAAGIPSFNALPPGSTPSVFTPQVGGGGPGVPAAAPSAAPSAAPPTTVPGIPAPTSAFGKALAAFAPGSRGVRNNNPLNLRPLGKGTWSGQTGVDDAGFAQFATPEAGMAAADRNLLAKGTLHGLTTINGIIADPKWGWDPGNTGYATKLAGALGVDPNQPLNLKDPSVRQAIFAKQIPMELGGSPPPGTAPAPGTPPGATPPAAPAGVAIGSRVGAPDHLIPGTEFPGGDPHMNYMVHADGTATAQAPSFSMQDVQSNRARFYASPEFKSASESIAPLQGLDRTVSAVAPGGVVGMASLDTLNKSLNPGGVVRPTTVQLFLDHIGLPEEVKSFISNTVGNGPLSPAVIKQIGQASWSYSRAHIDQASQLAQKDQALALAHGFAPSDVDESPPNVPPVPQWAQDPIPTPANRVPNKVYWGPTGPGKWTPKGWVRQ